MAKSAAPQADAFYVSPEPLAVEKPGGLFTGKPRSLSPVSHRAW